MVLSFIKINKGKLSHNLKVMAEVVVLESKLSSLAKPYFFSKKYTAF